MPKPKKVPEPDTPVDHAAVARLIARVRSHLADGEDGLAVAMVLAHEVEQHLATIDANLVAARVDVAEMGVLPRLLCPHRLDRQLAEFDAAVARVAELEAMRCACEQVIDAARAPIPRRVRA